MKIVDNQIILKDGTKIEVPKTGNIKLRMISNNSNEKVFLNGKEWKNGEFKLTISSILNYLFGYK